MLETEGERRQWQEGQPTLVKPKVSRWAILCHDASSIHAHAISCQTGRHVDISIASNQTVTSYAISTLCLGLSILPTARLRLLHTSKPTATPATTDATSR